MEAKRENSVEGFVTGLSSAKVGLETRGTHAARGTNTWIWSREQGKTILTLGGILFVLASLLAAQPAASLSSSELADGAASIPLFRLRRQSQSQQQAQTRNQLIQQQQRQLAASEQEEELMRNQLPVSSNSSEFSPGLLCNNTLRRQYIHGTSSESKAAFSRASCSLAIGVLIGCLISRDLIAGH